jgi:hypothetical protein
MLAVSMTYISSRSCSSGPTICWGDHAIRSIEITSPEYRSPSSAVPSVPDGGTSVAELYSKKPRRRLLML